MSGGGNHKREILSCGEDITDWELGNSDEQKQIKPKIQKTQTNQIEINTDSMEFKRCNRYWLNGREQEYWQRIDSNLLTRQLALPFGEQIMKKCTTTREKYIIWMSLVHTRKPNGTVTPDDNTKSYSLKIDDDKIRELQGALGNFWEHSLTRDIYFSIPIAAWTPIMWECAISAAHYAYDQKLRVSAPEELEKNKILIERLTRRVSELQEQNFVLKNNGNVTVEKPLLWIYYFVNKPNQGNPYITCMGVVADCDCGQAMVNKFTNYTKEAWELAGVIKYEKVKPDELFLRGNTIHLVAKYLMHDIEMEKPRDQLTIAIYASFEKQECESFYHGEIMRAINQVDQVARNSFVGGNPADAREFLVKHGVIFAMFTVVIQ